MNSKINLNEEIVFFQEQIKESLMSLENKLYLGVNEKGEYYRSIFFDELEILSDGKSGKSHNCVPCNLTDGINLIRYFLKTNLKCLHLKFFINTYSLLLYQQAERFGVIYSQIGYIDKKHEFDWNKFSELQMIKYWANFFKHPKSSLFLHHPTFHIESCPDLTNFMFDGVINSEFVKKCFCGGKFNKELEEKLSNKNYKIFFPDLIEFTNLICYESKRLIENIKSDERNIEKLKIFNKERT